MNAIEKIIRLGELSVALNQSHAELTVLHEQTEALLRQLNDIANDGYSSDNGALLEDLISRSMIVRQNWEAKRAEAVGLIREVEHITGRKFT